MNQSQKTYAMNRVNQIEAAHVTAIKAKYTKPAVGLTNAEKISLIRSGKVKLKSGGDFYYLLDSFDFSKLEKKAAVNQVAIDAEVKKLKAQADAVRDEIMLGDELAAKQLIEKFAKAFA